MTGSSNSSSTEIESKDRESITDQPQEDNMKSVLDKFTNITSLDDDSGQLLFDSGIDSLETLAETNTQKLIEILEIDEEKGDEIKDEAKNLLEDINTEEDSGDPISDLLKGKSSENFEEVLEENLNELQNNEDLSEKIESGDIDNLEALREWLEGDEDSFFRWLGEEEKIVEREEKIEEKEEEIEKKEKDLTTKMQTADSVKERFQERLKEIDTGEFDVDEIEEIYEENAVLQEKIDHLETEINELENEREELKEEISELRKGSITMLRYLKNKSADDKDDVSPIELEQEVKEELMRLQDENEELKEEIEKIKSKEGYQELDYSNIEDSDLKEELNDLKNKIESKDKEIKEKESKIQDLQSDLNLKKEELSKLKEKLEYKEDELSQREEDLKHREEVLKKQTQELESMKQEFGDMSEKERKRRLEELEKEISRKEQELKAKEKYIQQKQRELKAKQEDLIDEEIEDKQEEILQEIEQEKAKTGTSRLDDLMLGGIPLGSNVSIYGPPHCGKNVMINSFMAEGIEKGVPAVWVITDKTVDDIREEMKFVLPTYKEYERRGLIYYVDAYSISMGEVSEDQKDKENVAFIKEQSDLKGIREAVENFAEQIKEDHRYYRVAFLSVSTLIAYLDTGTTFRTLQPFAGRRKRDKAVSLYTLEKGMHSEQDISMFGHMMDGEIEFKFDQLKTYLRVEGLGDVQTRDWVEFSASKTGINMGSFSLDTIR